MLLKIYVVVIGLNAYISKLNTTKSAQVRYEYAANLRKRLFSAITNSNWLFLL